MSDRKVWQEGSVYVVEEHGDECVRQYTVTIEGLLDERDTLKRRIAELERRPSYSGALKRIAKLENCNLDTRLKAMEDSFEGLPSRITDLERKWETHQLIDWASWRWTMSKRLALLEELRQTLWDKSKECDDLARQLAEVKTSAVEMVQITQNMAENASSYWGAGGKEELDERIAEWRKEVGVEEAADG